MEQSRNSACIVPDTMSFFDAEYGAYVGDLEYITNYMTQDVQRYYNMTVKPGKIALDMTMGLRKSMHGHQDIQANEQTCTGTLVSSNSKCANPSIARKVDHKAATAVSAASTANKIQAARSML